LFACEALCGRSVQLPGAPRNPRQKKSRGRRALTKPSPGADNGEWLVSNKPDIKRRASTQYLPSSISAGKCIQLQIADSGACVPPYCATCSGRLYANQPKMLPTANGVFGTHLNNWLTCRVPAVIVSAIDNRTVVCMCSRLSCLNPCSPACGAHSVHT
jgi:hypothetical protein